MADACNCTAHQAEALNLREIQRLDMALTEVRVHLGFVDRAAEEVGRFKEQLAAVRQAVEEWQAARHQDITDCEGCAADRALIAAILGPTP